MASYDVKIAISGNSESAVKALNQTKDAVSKLENKTKTDSASIGASVNKLKMGYLVAAAAIAGAATAIGKFTSAAIAAEDAQNKLAQAMANQGILSTELLGAYKAQANALQQLTTFEDDAITGAQATLTMYGVEEDQMRKLTEATLDFAQSKGIDLRTASDLVGKSAGSSTNALARYGIEIEAGGTKAQRAAQLIEGLNEKFGGQAQNAALSYGGQIKQIKNSIGDMTEEIGFGILNGLQPMITKFKEFTSSAEGMEKIQHAGVILGAVFNLVGTHIGNVFNSIMHNVTNVGNVIGKLGDIIKDVFTNHGKETKKLFSELVEMEKDYGIKQVEIVMQAGKDIMKGSKKLVETLGDDWKKHYKGATITAKNGTKEIIAVNEELAIKLDEIYKRIDTVKKGMLESGLRASIDAAAEEGATVAKVMGATLRVIAKQIAEILTLKSIAAFAELNIPMGALYAGGAVAVLTAGNAAASAIENNPIKMFAEGGIINEPVYGVGASGARYMFGEAGPEKVTPMRGGDTNTNSISIGHVTVKANNAKEFMQGLYEIQRRTNTRMMARA